MSLFASSIAASTAATVYPTAASYFEAFPISPAGRGGEFDVFAAPHLVLKQLAESKVFSGTFKAFFDHAQRFNFAQRKRPSGLSGMWRNGQMVAVQWERQADQMDQEIRQQFDEIKEKCGGLVLPFERPLQVHCRLHRLCGLWRETEVFTRPIVQPRLPKQAVLSHAIAAARKEHDYDAMKRLIDGAFRTMDGLLGRGFFMYDAKPDNLCVFEGALLLLDMGAVWKVGKNVRAVFDSYLRNRRLARYASLWEKAIRDNATEETSRRSEALARFFRSRFEEFNTWRHVLKLKGGGGAQPVPDVFPFKPTAEIISG